MATTIELGSTIDFPWGRNDGYRHIPDSIKIDGQNVTANFIAAHPDWNIQLPVYITQIYAVIPGVNPTDTPVVCSDLVKWNPAQETIAFPTLEEIGRRASKLSGDIISSGIPIPFMCVISVRSTYVNPSGETVPFVAEYKFVAND